MVTSASSSTLDDCGWRRRVVLLLSRRRTLTAVLCVCSFVVHLCRDPLSFKSVHLLDEKLKAEMAEAAKREMEEWKAKVVVDNVKFQPTFGVKQLSQVSACPLCTIVLRLLHHLGV